jgi:hypothetical protein
MIRTSLCINFGLCPSAAFPLITSNEAPCTRLPGGCLQIGWIDRDLLEDLAKEYGHHHSAHRREGVEARIANHTLAARPRAFCDPCCNPDNASDEVVVPDVPKIVKFRDSPTTIPTNAGTHLPIIISAARDKIPARSPPAAEPQVTSRCVWVAVMTSRRALISAGTVTAEMRRGSKSTAATSRSKHLLVARLKISRGPDSPDRCVLGRMTEPIGSGQNTRCGPDHL